MVHRMGNALSLNLQAYQASVDGPSRELQLEPACTSSQCLAMRRYGHISTPTAHTQQI